MFSRSRLNSSRFRFSLFAACAIGITLAEGSYALQGNTIAPDRLQSLPQSLVSQSSGSATPTTSPRSASSETPVLEWVGWLALALASVAVLSLIYRLLLKPRSPQLPEDPAVAEDSSEPLKPERSVGEDQADEDYPDRSEAALAGEMTRLTKVDIVETLIADLNSADPGKRRQAIWQLGQRGDSRATQPLVDLLMDSDSMQRSLILAAISEIGMRSLKPMHRALMLSLQDNSPDVRKNAIRDVTRMYDAIAQVSQLLQYATSDADSEVRETAQWALSQMNRIRSLPEDTALPRSPQLHSSSEDAAED
ncbi:MAG: HEAT repeat domain-containing protein [Oscillatoriophycideae cyanobacterium NC_groundwater_1537_Pr4_S-0.65um_50_18]|nr:HEAT repeat domain-containing protein [Oscillatoriophycideae cyanobacterium NC_groundwater_1537_Pr4_S-0.65um_50_18]